MSCRCRLLSGMVENAVVLCESGAPTALCALLHSCERFNDKLVLPCVQTLWNIVELYTYTREAQGNTRGMRTYLGAGPIELAAVIPVLVALARALITGT
jgi:hypothetical protein